MPGASIRNRTGGYGPPRSGWQTKVSIAPSLVGISRIFSIMCLGALLVLVGHASTLLGFTQLQSPGRGPDEAFVLRSGCGRGGPGCPGVWAATDRRYGEAGCTHRHVEPLFRHQ